MAELAVGIDQPRDGRLGPRRVGINARLRPARGDLDLTHILQRRCAMSRRPRPGRSASADSSPRSGSSSNDSRLSSVPWLRRFQASRVIAEPARADRSTRTKAPPPARATNPFELSYAEIEMSPLRIARSRPVREFLRQQGFEDGPRPGRCRGERRAGRPCPANRIHQDITRQTQVTQEVLMRPARAIFRLRRESSGSGRSARWGNRRGSSSGP